MADKANEIVITTVDDTAGGLEAISARFDEFDQQVGKLEKNLKPVAQIINSGLATGTAITGLAAYAGSAGNLQNALASMQSSLLGIGTAAAEGDSELAKVSQTILDTAAGFTKFFGILKAGLEVGKQIKVATLAVNAILAEQAAIRAAAATVVNKETAAETANTIAKTNNAVATGAVSVSSGIASVAMGALNAVTNTCAAAFGAFNVVLSLNPILAIVGGVTALVGAFGIVIPTIWSWVSAENAEANAAEKIVRNATRKRKTIEELHAVYDTYIQRLQLLHQKETLNATDKLELARIVETLNEKYRGLNLTIDETTGKIQGNAAAITEANKRIAEEAIDALQKEEQALARQQTALRRRLRKEENEFRIFNIDWAGDENEIKTKLTEIAEARKEITSKLKEARDELTNAELEEQNRTAEARKATEEAMKAGLEIQASLQKEIDDATKSALQKEIDGVEEKLRLRNEELRRLQQAGTITQEQARKEFEALQKIGNERKAQIEERYRLEEQQAQERERLEVEKAEKDKLLKEAQADAKAQDDALRYQQEIQKLRQAWNEAQKADTAGIAALANTNPKEALAQAGASLATARGNVERFGAQYGKRLDSVTADGIITDAERRMLETIRNQYDTAVQERNTYQSQYDTARQQLEGNITALLSEIQGTESPLDAMARGSIEAFRKELEIDQAQQKPDVAVLRNIEKLITDKLAERQKVEEETRDFTKRIVDNVIGI